MRYFKPATLKALGNSLSFNLASNNGDTCGIGQWIQAQISNTNG